MFGLFLRMILYIIYHVTMRKGANIIDIVAVVPQLVPQGQTEAVTH